MLLLPVRNPRWRLYLKLEKFNPGQSMKDRMARAMVEGAERRGLLRPGGTIIESSSGNTAIGLAMIAAARGYRFIAVVDHHATPEKISVLRAYGAGIVQVGDGYAPDRVAVTARENAAERLADEIPGAVYMNQADNPDNPAGYEALAAEILDGIDVPQCVIGAIGTGGSLCGVARSLKRRYPGLEVVAIEPQGSIIFGGPEGPYYQSGTGSPGGAPIAGNIDKTVIDDHGWVTDTQAFMTARFLARERGLLVGGSAGGVVYKALERIESRSGAGIMLALLADGGERYLSTIFDDDWMREHGLLDDAIYEQVRSCTERAS